VGCFLCAVPPCAGGLCWCQVLGEQGGEALMHKEDMRRVVPLQGVFQGGSSGARLRDTGQPRGRRGGPWEHGPRWAGGAPEGGGGARDGVSGGPVLV